VRNGLCIRVPRLVGEARELADELEPTKAQRPDSLTADPDPAHLRPVASQLTLERESATEHLRVEGAREPAVAGERRDRDRPDLVALLKERQPSHGRARTRRPGHQLDHTVGVRAHRLDPLLRAAQP
jgi:hypothetical protein